MIPRNNTSPNIMKTKSTIILKKTTNKHIEGEMNELDNKIIIQNANLHPNIKKIPKWKLNHENFIKNIKFNKNLKEMEMRGEDTSNLRPPETLNPDYVPCPYCMRKFAPSKSYCNKNF